MKPYAPHYAEHLRAAMQCTRANSTVPEWMDAWDAFKRSQAYERGANLRQETSRRWRAATGAAVRRSAAGNSNKFLIGHSVRAVEMRGAAITQDVLEASREYTRALRENGATRQQTVAARVEVSRKRAADAHSAVMQRKTKRAVLDDDSLDFLAAAVRPSVPQTASGMLNLDASGSIFFGAPFVKETVAQELEARGLSPKRNKKDFKPSESLASLLDQLRSYEEGASIIKRKVVDYDSPQSESETSGSIVWKKARH
jgi:hypothetical protein